MTKNLSLIEAISSLSFLSLGMNTLGQMVFDTLESCPLFTHDDITFSGLK